MYGIKLYITVGHKHKLKQFSYDLEIVQSNKDFNSFWAFSRLVLRASFFFDWTEKEYIVWMQICALFSTLLMRMKSVLIVEIYSFVSFWIQAEKVYDGFILCVNWFLQMHWHRIYLLNYKEAVFGVVKKIKWRLLNYYQRFDKRTIWLVVCFLLLL